MLGTLTVLTHCVCRHEILPPKLPGFLPSCRNDACPTQWWNRITQPKVQHGNTHA